MRNTLLFLAGVLAAGAGYGQGQAQTRGYAHTQGRLAVVEGAKSVLFMADSAGTPNGESTPTFSPDGKMVYIANNNNIFVAKRLGRDRWAKPTPIGFTGQYKDWDPTLTPDGKRLLFVSNRVYTASDGSKKRGNHLWISQLTADGKWSEPQHLDSPVNQAGLVNYGPSISASGTVCFCSGNRDGNKGMHAYLSAWARDHYEKPKVLLLNGNEPTYDPYIAPDERYIIFSSDSALFISYKTDQGWSQGEKLGPQVNDAAKAGMLWGPSVSRDGKTLYYNGGTVDGIEMIPVRWVK